jgi:hypothetical protein
MTQGLEDVASDVFGRRIDFLEVFHVVQELVIQFVDDFFCGGLDSFEINQDAVRFQLLSGHKDFDFPVMPVQILTSAFKFSELVSTGHLGDDLQFIHGSHPGGSGGGLRVGFAAFAALAVNDNARAVSVWTENPVFNVQPFFRIAHAARLCLEQYAAGHAIAAFPRDLCSALRAHLTRDLLVTMRTFHIQFSQLAFFGSFDLERHNFLFDPGALALGAPELRLVIF